MMHRNHARWLFSLKLAPFPYIIETVDEFTDKNEKAQNKEQKRIEEKYENHIGFGNNREHSGNVHRG